MKKKLIMIFSIIVLFITLILIIIYRKQTIAVLGYHDFIVNDSNNGMQINIEKFDKQMKYLKDHNYNTITLKQMDCFINKTCKIPRKSVLITMDDGYKSNYELAFKVLKKYNFNGVVFYMGVNYNGGNENYMDLNMIKEAKRKYPNIEFASHTYDLHHENDYLLSYEEINNDFKKMNNVIDTKYFAYPYGHVSYNIERALKNNDYKLAFTFGPGRNHRKVRQDDDKYHLPRLFISNDMPFWKFVLRLVIPY